MTQENLLIKVKELRKITGAGFNDCNIAIKECGGDIEKSIEFLRIKGISKVSTKIMERIAKEGLICIYNSEEGKSIIEINCETDFVAKNKDFITFAEEISKLALVSSGIMEDILISKMINKKNVKSNLIDFISKIGEKITLRRSAFIGTKNSVNFSYTHSSLKKNIGKLGVLLSLETTKSKNDILDLGKRLAMQVAASSPLAIDKDDIDQNVLQKEKEIITEELKNSKKDSKVIDKIVMGKLNKFISENTLLNQEWVMEPKKKVREVIKEIAGNDKIKIKNFIRFKVGEGV